MTPKEQEIIDEIADYIFPVFTFEGRKFVPLDNADYLRRLARELSSKKP